MGEALGEEEEGEGEEDLDEEAEGEEEIFVFVVTQPRHFVLHIPNTPPHHHLCSFDEKKGARRDRLRQFEIYPNPTVRKTPKKIPIQRAKCQTNPPSSKNDRTSRYKTNKNIAKRWCFLSKKQKRILSSPFKTKQKFPLSNRTKKQNFALFCS